MIGNLLKKFGYTLLIIPMIFLFKGCGFGPSDDNDPDPFDKPVADWSRQFIEFGDDFWDVYFTPSGYGWVVGDLSIVYSTSTGETWTLAPAVAETASSYQSVFFFNDSKGWMVGTPDQSQQGQIYYSENSGAYPIIQATTGYPLYSIFFIDQFTGWAGGGNGIILRTTDGGANWITDSISTKDAVFDIQFYDQNIGWVVTANGGIYRTPDGGVSWQTENTGALGNILAIQFIDTLHMWACGAKNSILKRTAGQGDSIQWVRETIIVESPNMNWKDIIFVDDTTGWMIGDYHSVYRTGNAGLTWEKETIETTDAISAISMVSKTAGWIAGEKGTIFKYTPLEEE